MVLLTEVAFLLLSAVLLVNALLPQPAAVAALRVRVRRRRARRTAATLARRAAAAHRRARRARRRRRAERAQRRASRRWPVPRSAASSSPPSASGRGYARRRRSPSPPRCVALAMMRPVPPPEGAERPSLRGIGEGLGYAWSRKDLLGTYLVDLSAMFFAFPYALFPFVADALHAPWALGLLYSAGFLGGALATATSGWTRHVHHHGRAIVYASALWGAAIAAFGLRARHLVRAGDARGRGGRRHGQRDLPPADVEPDHPGRACAGGWPAPSCCRTRWDRSSDRSARASSRSGRRCAFSIVSGGVGLRRWVRSCSRGAAVVVALRRADRRERSAREDVATDRGGEARHRRRRHELNPCVTRRAHRAKF